MRQYIVTGTPGIGKSLFLLFFLWNLLKENKRVIFIFSPDIIYFDNRGNISRLEKDNFDFVHKGIDFWNRDLWCLFDAKDQKDLMGIPYIRCNFILSMSPRRDLINDFVKEAEYTTFYMPIWKESELKNIFAWYPKAIKYWEDRFKILGGIPRFVLEKLQDTASDLLTEAIRECTLDDCIKTIGLKSQLTEKSKYSHRLVHMTSKFPYEESSVEFASDYAFELICQKHNDEAQQKMNNLLISCEGQPLMNRLCSYFYEKQAIDDLEKGGKFECRCLLGDKVGETKKIEMPPSTKQTVLDIYKPNRTRNGQKNKILYVPQSKNFPGVDAWMHGIGGFQITVGKSHKKMPAPTRERIRNRIRNGKAIYYAMPNHYFNTFNKVKDEEDDNPDTLIPQYALRLPYKYQTKEPHVYQEI